MVGTAADEIVGNLSSEDTAYYYAENNTGNSAYPDARARASSLL